MVTISTYPLLKGLPIDDAIKLLRELDPNGNLGLLAASTMQLQKLANLTHDSTLFKVAASLLAHDPLLSVDDLISKFFDGNSDTQSLVEEMYRFVDENR